MPKVERMFARPARLCEQCDHPLSRCLCGRWRCEPCWEDANVECGCEEDFGEMLDTWGDR